MVRRRGGQSPHHVGQKLLPIAPPSPNHYAYIGPALGDAAPPNPARASRPVSPSEEQARHFATFVGRVGLSYPRARARVAFKIAVSRGDANGTRLAVGRAGGSLVGSYGVA